jgi:endonuclease G, mitochondrial
LRRNYPSTHRGLSKSFRVVVFTFIVFAAAVIIAFLYKDKLMGMLTPKSTSSIHKVEDVKTYLPSSHGEVIEHTYYTLSYIENAEQAEWVAYHMDRDMLNVPNIGRDREFRPDPNVSTQSATHRDYTGSGYTRGHLAPAGDMAFDSTAMRESFYMSNISPQVRAFNNGVWKELEENVRDWTYKAKDLYIITGPILDEPIKTIGRGNKVKVPSAFYKILLDYNHKKAIAFIIPHRLSEEPLQSFMTSIDEVELITGIDFFPDMLTDTEQLSLESAFDPSLWNVSDKRFQLRLSKWNYE